MKIKLLAILSTVIAFMLKLTKQKIIVASLCLVLLSVIFLLPIPFKVKIGMALAIPTLALKFWFSDWSFFYRFVIVCAIAYVELLFVHDMNDVYNLVGVLILCFVIHKDEFIHDKMSEQE